MQATPPRKLVYYIAMTADHYIAHDDTSIDGFPMQGQHVTDYLESLRDYDTVLMGRRTYEWGFQFGIEPGQPAPTYGHMMQYVFSQSMQEYDHEQLKVIRDNPADFVKTLKAEEGGSIYLCGGGKLAGHLFNAGLVVELILKVNPVVYGQGIPLLDGVATTAPLTLLKSTAYKSGVIFLHYALAPSPADA